MSSFAEVEAALARGDHAAVLALTDAILGERPGDDAAHELRARSLLALRRHDEAEEHAQAAVRLDPEEIRYRELLAEVLSAAGAHRDAAIEYGRLARNDPRQTAWLIAGAGEHLEAAEAGQGIDAARAAVRLDPRSGHAQLTLAQALVRVGDARGAYQAAGAALRLLGSSPEARETLADAQWLSGERPQALDAYRALVGSLTDAPRERVLRKARALYAQGAGWLGRRVAAIPPLFALALRLGWVRIAS
ncbi:MAG: tetratricopeptide repeat protein [Chloroflexota bacterium]